MKKFLSILVLFALVLGLSACGGKKAAEPAVDLAAMLAEFNLNEEDMMPLDLSDLEMLYGIKAEDVKQSAAAMHVSGINCDEIILIEAVDSAAAGRVKTLLDSRYQAKLNEMRDYIAEQYAIIEACSVTQSGNFVAMIVSPDADRMVEIYSKSVK